MEALTYAVLASAHIEVIEGVKALAVLQDGNGRIAGVLAKDASTRLTNYFRAKRGRPLV